MNKKPIAIITGASRGLGYAVAKVMAQYGYSLILVSKSKIDTTKFAYHDNVVHSSYALDLMNDHSLNELINILISGNNIPDVIIHNLGGKIEGDQFPIQLSVLQDSLKYNLEIALQIDQNLMPAMQKRRNGRIIYISSDASLNGRASPSYVISKSALNGYIKSMAQYYAKDNIMICGVLPGIFEHAESAWTKKKIEEPINYQNKISQMPLGRFGNVEEIADFIVKIANSDNMMTAGGLFELCGAAR